MDVLAGADFFTVEVLTWRGLVTYYVLFCIEVGSRRVRLGGITRHPESSWMQQVARNATMEGAGYLNGCRYLLHDRDRKFCHEFRDTLASGSTFDQRGMLVKADLVWGALAAARRVGISGTLSPREKPPRQGQSFAFPHLCSARAQCATCDPL
jgi:hypothetical protein